MAKQRKPVIGVMGAGGDASASDIALAERLGELIAREGWVLLTGGRDCGVMAAANRGAKRVAGSLTVGVLPGTSESGGVCPDVDVAIFTDMGNARNNINVLSSDVVIACGSGGAGTASEIALAIKTDKPVVLVATSAECVAYFERLAADRVFKVATAEAVIELIRRQRLIQ